MTSLAAPIQFRAVAVNGIPKLSVGLEEAAEALSISISTFKRQVLPEIRCKKRGNTYYIPLTELERWLHENIDHVTSWEMI